MRIGNARKPDIFGKVVAFFERLINFLFAYGVLCELITAGLQAANYQRGSKKNLLHGVPLHDAIVLILT